MDSGNKKPVTAACAGSYGSEVYGVDERIRTADLQIHNLNTGPLTDDGRKASDNSDAECTGKRTENVSTIEHDLAELIVAWPRLDHASRSQILALIRRAGK